MSSITTHDTTQNKAKIAKKSIEPSNDHEFFSEIKCSPCKNNLYYKRNTRKTAIIFCGIIKNNYLCSNFLIPIGNTIRRMMYREFPDDMTRAEITA